MLAKSQPRTGRKAELSCVPPKSGIFNYWAVDSSCSNPSAGVTFGVTGCVGLNFALVTMKNTGMEDTLVIPQSHCAKWLH